MKARQALSTGIIVVFMTLIVWVAADRAVLRNSPEMIVPLEVSAPSAGYRVTVLEPDPSVMRVRFRGPGHAIDAMVPGEGRTAFRYTLTQREAEQAVQSESDQIVLNPKQGFQSLAEEGVSTDPINISKIVVKVEAVERIKVRVDLSSSDRKQVAEGYLIRPAEVSATVPSAPDIRKRIEEEQLFAMPQIDLNAPELLSGRESTQTVRLVSSISGVNVTFLPPQVEVVFRRLIPPEKSTISGIRIRLQGPPEVFAKYDVVLVDPILNNLKIKGPRADLAALKPEDVKAILVLQADDRPNVGSYKIAPLEIQFPKGSHVWFDDDAAPPTVTYNLKPKASADAPPEGAGP